jgi:hypothetical protein
VQQAIALLRELVIDCHPRPCQDQQPIARHHLLQDVSQDQSEETPISAPIHPRTHNSIRR